MNWMLSKWKTFAFLKICLRKQKDKSKIEENISKHSPHIVLYTEYIKNSFNSIIKIQIIQCSSEQNIWTETLPKIYEW